MPLAGPTEVSRIILYTSWDGVPIETPARTVYLIRNICGIRCGRVRYGNQVRHCIAAKNSRVWYEIPDTVAIVHAHKLELKQEKM